MVALWAAGAQLPAQVRLRVALASLWFAVLIALPWAYLVPWRPAWLLPTSAELAFSIIKLSIAATLVAAGAALVIREGSLRTAAA